MDEQSFVTLEGEESDETHSEREPEPNLGGTRRKSMCFVEIRTNGKTQSVVLNINRDITEAAERLKRDDAAPVKVHQSMRKITGSARGSTPPPVTAIAGLPEVIESDEEDECPICMDVIDPPSSLTTSCMHNFHQTCLLSFLQYKNLYQCPFCKQAITDVTPYNASPLTKDKLLEMLYNSASDVQFNYDATELVAIDKEGKGVAKFKLQLVDTLGKPSVIDKCYRVEAVASCTAPDVVLKNFISDGNGDGVINFDNLLIHLPPGYNLASGLFLSVRISCEHETDELELLCDGKEVDVEIDFEEPPPAPAPAPAPKPIPVSQGSQTVLSVPASLEIGASSESNNNSNNGGPKPPPPGPRPPSKIVATKRQRKEATKDTECGCTLS